MVDNDVNHKLKDFRMTTRLYKTSSEASKCLNEYNDCVVKAVSIATGIDYFDVHARFKDFGRKDRKGTPIYVVKAVMNHYARTGKIKSWKEIKPRSHYEVKGKKITGKWSMKTIGKNSPKGTTGICFIKGHAAAMVNNEIHDWTEGRRHVVEEIYVIEK